MKFTYYGHSCFSVNIEGKNLLFDPFVAYNELANAIVAVDRIEADYIFITHGHFDHTADCVRIASRTGAKVICNWEIHEWLIRQEIVNTHPMNTGGKWHFPGFLVKAVVAHHSSSLSDGSYAGNPLGFIISTADTSFYYSGDTALTLDMQLIPRWAKLNFAVLPIGDNFTMDATDAAECARMIGCKKIVGVHYDTFGFIRINREEAKQAFTNAGAELHLIDIGATVDL